MSTPPRSRIPVTALDVGARRVLAALLALVMMLSVGLVTATTASADTGVYPNVGQGRSLNYYGSHWLGANQGPNGELAWCIEYGPMPPNPGSMFNPSEMYDSGAHRSDTDPALYVNHREMAQIIHEYQYYDTSADGRAAISLIAHANYDVTSNGGVITAEAIRRFPVAYSKAKNMVAWAHNNTPKDGGSGSAQSTRYERAGTFNGLWVSNQNDGWLSGTTMWARANGPAVFNDTGSNTWQGASRSYTVNLGWTATSNGQVCFELQYEWQYWRLMRYSNGGSAQDELVAPNVDKQWWTAPTNGCVPTYYDFKPQGTSQVVAEEDGIDTDGFTSDTLTTSVDSSYSTPGWMSQGGSYIPVVYRATAYWSRSKPTRSGTVPAAATKLGEQTLTARGPGEKLTARVPLTKRGYVTWVWEVRKADQGGNASYIAADWKDQFGIPAETQPVNKRFSPTGTSQVHTREVNTDGAISDSLTVSYKKNFEDGEWTRQVRDGDSFDTATYVPVVYRATAYWSRSKPARSDRVPSSAVKIGEQKLTATGPDSKLTAKLSTAKRGYVTWVWTVSKADQGQWAKYIGADWADGYGIDAETSVENFDFQPIGTSTVERHEVNTDGRITDTFVAKADPSYRDGEWTRHVRVGDSFDTASYVPVVYTATAYWSRTYPTQQANPPQGAAVIGSTKVTAHRPGEKLTATLDLPKDKRGYVTWVWSVNRSDQGENAKWIKADWHDTFALPQEVGLENFRFQPTGTSKAHARKVNTDGTITDTLTTAVDPGVWGGEWTRLVSTPESFDKAAYVPVTYTATAYISRTKPTQSRGVPAGAEKVGSVNLTAAGPGKDLTATLHTDKRGYVTWVWSVSKAAQPYKQWIEADWADSFALPEETTIENFDFQPKGVSHVHQVEVNEDGQINDFLDVFADKAFRDGEWTRQVTDPLSFDEAPYVPVVFTATAYWSRSKPARADRVPAGAEQIGQMKVTATGPNQTLKASLPLAKRGYVTWVWSMLKSDQGQYADWINADWADGYGIDAETSVENFPFRPVGVSHVQRREVNTDGKITDQLVANADTAFRDGEWTRYVDSPDSFNTAPYVPVVYTATAYWSRSKPPTSQDVPEDATVIGSTKVTAHRPGETITATLDLPKDKRGYITWVWGVNKEDQDPEAAKWIKDAWFDSYGLPEETSIENFRFQPKGTSKFAWKDVYSNGDITDTLTTEVDPDVWGGEWTRLVSDPMSFDEAPYVPVTYTATAYISRTKPTQSGTVPAGAEKVGSVDMVASGPGQDLTATLRTDKRGWVTWVWSVVKDKQPYKQWIEADWADSFALPAETGPVNFQFQPKGVSHVHTVEVNRDGKINDTLDVFADPNVLDGEWTRQVTYDGASTSFDTAPYVPVVYTATAYWSREKPQRLDQVPDGAVKLGSQKVTAHGPGSLKATMDIPKRGYVTWVWSMLRVDQGQYAKWIKADWADGYGIPDETSIENFPFRPIGTSKAEVHEVNRDGFISDTLTTAPDPDYRDGEWTRYVRDGESFDKARFVPVTYTATAYISDDKPAQADQVPAGAVKVGSTTVTAQGPGQEITARLRTDRRGWVTWVWSVDGAQDKDATKWIEAGWSDKFGLDAETVRENFDFRPMGVSSVADAKIQDDTLPPTDTLVTKTDPSFRDGQWTRLVDADGQNTSFASAPYVPVVYTATAYRLPATLTQKVPLAQVPADAEVLGTVKVTAHGPGEKLTATLDHTVDPGLVTWVWSVDPADQGEYAKWIAADWSWHDPFGLIDETQSQQGTAKITTSINIHHRENGDFLSDDIYVSGLPEDHGEFTGGLGLAPDATEITNTLYFFPEDTLPVTDENLPKATVLGSVTIPAKNGTYLKTASDDFKVTWGQAGAGTYVFVTSFPGDDRVKPFTSSVTDTREQYVAHVTPEIKTTATDTNGGKTLLPYGDVTITDKVCQVKYHDLKPGKTYTVTATAMDKTTGEPFTDADGNPYTGTTTWTPTGPDECVNVDVTLPAKALWGTSVVMFEDVTYEGKSVAIHADIEDEDQTVPGPETPGIKTTLTVPDGSKQVDRGPVELVDKVCPTNEHTFTPGTTYRVYGTLMDKETGQAVTGKDGQPVTASTEFTATTTGDCVDIAFTLDTQDLAGHDLVAFERSTVVVTDTPGENTDNPGENPDNPGEEPSKPGEQEYEYATHEDINDVDQTIHVRYGPEIGTTLTDKTDGDHEVNPGPVTLTDMICPKNDDTWIIGQTYTVEGTLMDKTTGKPVTTSDGTPVTAHTTFTPRAVKECATVDFKFDTKDLADHDLVAYEEVYDAQGDLYADHKDLDDKDQTVHVGPVKPLPKTGAALIGITLMSAAGLIGAGTALVRRRRA